MDKKYLLETAQAINPVSNATVEEYNQKIDLLVNAINTRMLERPDIEKLIGENNELMMKDNHANHARFMASVFQNYIPNVLIETVLWVFRAYRSRSFASNYWAAQLNTWLTILEIELSASAYKEIAPFYVWMQTNIPVFVALSDEKIESEFSKH